MELWIVVWVVCGIAAALIGRWKGRTGTDDFVIGVLLGPLGIVFALLAKRQTPDTPKGPDWG